MEMYSLFDRKLKEYGALMLDRNDLAIGRACVDFYGAQGNGSLAALHPEDFDLHQVGSFDRSTGRVFSCDVPRFVGNLRDLIANGGVNGGSSETA